MLFYQELFLKCAEFPKNRQKSTKMFVYVGCLVFYNFGTWKCYLHDIEIYVSQNVEFVSKVNSSQHYHKNRLQLETIPDFSPKFSNMSCGKAIYFNRPVICPKCQSQITFRLNKGNICRSCSIHILLAYMQYTYFLLLIFGRNGY